LINYHTSTKIILDSKLNYDFLKPNHNIESLTKSERKQTRSQAVARIADHTASRQTI